MYRTAGQPSFRRISEEIASTPGMPDTVSHETVSSLLSGNAIPRWSKVECVVRVLAKMAVHRPDPEAEVQRFLALWNAKRDNRSGGPAPVPPDPPPNASETPPVSEPPSANVPARNPGFIGREDLMEIMRARLDATPWQPLVLHGLGGVGKTSIASEFVHRERHRYDHVWWITAEQTSQARSTLAALADRAPFALVGSQSDIRLTINKVLAELERSSFSWLIVFDNAAGPELIRPLMPADRGAVIITTRDGSWTRIGRTVPVDVLPRRDSIALLQSRSDISFDDADQLAARLGDLPLALEQASAMRATTGISVDAYLARLDRHATSVLAEGRPAGYPETVASAFGLTFDDVRAESPGAAQLLAMLSCMSAESVSLGLLRAASDETIPPPLSRVLVQDDQLEAALQLLEQYGLLTLVDDGQKLRVHRLVQLIVRDSLSEHDGVQAYRNARRLLIEANPGDPDTPLTWEMHAEIGPHIRPARLLDDPESPGRRVVLDHIRYLYVLGDFDGSLRLSAEARRSWAGPDDVWDDDETFAAIDRYASALIGLGRYREADSLYQEAWVRLTTHERFGEGHDRTARTASGVAFVSRILGNYGIGVNLDRYRVDHYERRGGPEDPEAVRARANLAVSYRAMGSFGEALAIDEKLVEFWRTNFGEDDYRTQLAVSNLARDQYGLGEYENALTMQLDNLSRLRDGLRGRHPYTVLATRTVATALRKVGRIAEALELSRDHHLTCQGEWGSEHGYTLAAAMTYANAIRMAVAAGEAGGLTLAVASNTSRRAVNTYRQRFGANNPLTLAAATNHAIILRATGERTLARNTVESAHRQLTAEVGADHPYVQAAAVGLANDRVGQYDQEGAVRLLRTTLSTARNAGRAEHPDTLVCAINLGLLTRAEDPQSAQTLIEPALNTLRERLGAEHPQVVAAARGERGECDIEPPPF
ncbi:FxSxx-COOH system tetratricopeptide repeat protein [Actinoplanes solisilvae]|uniref:FxSxx-COOH system tetratricopeptide repeat protein n=1 Tax=Actinoplanes solisilvae TaxID=2486853 RepID=UPI000FDB21B0|nr:FxSxx-COOH system tetratricopeptide repeat protein [Actinoplanes solisilvae]